MSYEDNMQTISPINTIWGKAHLNGGYYRLANGTYLHRKIFELFYGSIPKGYHIHHKDGNPLNNCIINLKLIKISEHQSMHHKGMNHSDETKKLISEKLKGREVWNKGKTLSYAHKKKLSEAQKGEKHHRYKNYARVVKLGKNVMGKQRYCIKENTKQIKYSIFPLKLVEWYKKEYPNKKIEYGGIYY